jgi:hypothetical protein
LRRDLSPLAPPTPADPNAKYEPIGVVDAYVPGRTEFAYSPKSLGPALRKHAIAAGVPPEFLAAIVQRESSFINRIKHEDGIGAGLTGITRGKGLMPDFLKKYNLKDTGDVFPIDAQLEYTANKLKEYATDKKTGKVDWAMAARKWHRGESQAFDEGGDKYLKDLRESFNGLYPGKEHPF